MYFWAGNLSDIRTVVTKHPSSFSRDWVVYICLNYVLIICFWFIILTVLCFFLLYLFIITNILYYQECVQRHYYASLIFTRYYFVIGYESTSCLSLILCWPLICTHRCNTLSLERLCEFCFGQTFHGDTILSVPRERHLNSRSPAVLRRASITLLRYIPEQSEQQIAIDRPNSAVEKHLFENFRSVPKVTRWANAKLNANPPETREERCHLKWRN